MAIDAINCTFSLLNQGRVYSGNHRKYLIENAREVCYAPATRERIKLREAYGYYGHGRRILTGKMNLGEVEVAQLPDGTQALVSNIPSNVTLAFDVAEDGTVTHSQEFLNTEPGKIVRGLHESRVGGFSWACPGTPGGTSKPTRISGFAGFDYVLNPGFSENRGYVLESADPPVLEQMILESVAAAVGNDALAEQYVKGWMSDAHNRLMVLENALFESEAREADLLGTVHEQEQSVASLATEKQHLEDTLRADRAGYADMIGALAKSFPCFIPESAMHDMLNGDFTRAMAVFEQASMVDFSQYPLLKTAKQNERELPPALDDRQRQPDYGTAMYGFGIFGE